MKAKLVVMLAVLASVFGLVMAPSADAADNVYSYAPVYTWWSGSGDLFNRWNDTQCDANTENNCSSSRNGAKPLAITLNLEFPVEQSRLCVAADVYGDGTSAAKTGGIINPGYSPTGGRHIYTISAAQLSSKLGLAYSKVNRLYVRMYQYGGDSAYEAGILTPYGLDQAYMSGTNGWCPST